MTRPRSQLVSLEATPYYHCIARCVRRAWLCGRDKYSGKNFDHRKPWLLERLKLLADVFAVDIAAYAVMSNHYHLVIHIDSERTARWSDEQVVQRWTRLYSGPDLIQQFRAGKQLSEEELSLCRAIVQRWRTRLADISWFMRCLNEYLARRANQEDGCKGRFWEARFKSQALLDETALLSCMAYVDLNPVRAGISDSLLNSDFTSVQDRIKAIANSGSRTRGRAGKQQKMLRLMPFSEGQQEQQGHAMLPYNFKDYLELVDWTGRVIRADKKGFIPKEQPNLLGVLGISDKQWKQLALEVQKESISMLHGLDKLAVIERSKPGKKVA